jgi:hypothetical protein
VERLQRTMHIYNLEDAALKDPELRGRGRPLPRQLG